MVRWGASCPPWRLRTRKGRAIKARRRPQRSCLALTEGAPLERIRALDTGSVGAENDRMPDPEQTATHTLAGTRDAAAHSRRVAAQVGEALGVVEPEWRAALGAAGWLHDIGYCRAALDTGFHPLRPPQEIRPAIR
jgi:hypothetical protein